MPRGSKPAPTVGDIVHIKFLDHCQKGDELMEFETFGRILDDHELFYKIGHWMFTCDVQRERCGKENEDSYAIGKGLIMEIKCLK